MANPQYAVTVTDEATLLVPADPRNRPVFVQIVGNKTVYLGNDAVTSSNGFPIVKHSAPIQGVLGPSQALYGICATGNTEEVRVFTVPQGPTPG
jgi:hypothetical protein